MKFNILIILFLITYFASFSQDKTELKLTEIEKIILNKNYNEAFDMLNSILETNKTYSKAYYLRSKISKETGNIKGAISDLSSAIENDKLNDFYFAQRGEIYLNEKKYNKAYDDFKQAYVLNKNNIVYLLKISITEFHLKKQNEATNNIKQYLETYPDDDLANYYYALYNFETENISSTIEYLDKSIQKNQSKYEYFLLRGKAYEKNGLYNLADNDYGMVLDLNPKIAEAYFYRANLKQKQGNKQDACLNWQKALDLKYYKANEFLQKYCW